MSRTFLLLLGLGLLSLPCLAQGPAGPELPTPTTFRAANWETAGSRTGKPGPRRIALLLGVGEHKNREAWVLPWVRNDLRVFRAALEGLGGNFEVEERVDGKVTRDLIENYFLIELPRQLSKDEPHVLLVYFSGHGVIQGSDRCYYTHLTDLVHGRYTNLLTEADLSLWVSKLKAEVKGIQVFFFLDACAPTEKGPVGRPVEAFLGDAVFYASQRGELAELGTTERPGEVPLKDRVSAFTQALAASIQELGQKDPLTLQSLEDRLKSRYGRGETLQAKGAPPLADLVLHDKENLCFELRAVDGLTGEPVSGARVTTTDQDYGRTPCRIRGLGKGTYRFPVAAEHFLRRTVEVDVDIGRHGGVFTVPLYPRYLILEGRLEGGGPGLDVETLGPRGGPFYENYHRAFVPLSGDGAFRLFLPLSAQPDGVRLKREGSPLAVREFALAELGKVDNALEGNIVPTYSLGAFRLAEATPSAAAAGLALTGMAKTYLEEAERFAGAGPACLEEAIECYKLARKAAKDEATGTQLDNRIRASYDRLLRHCASEKVQDFALGARVAGEALDWEPASLSFRAWRERCERENIPADLRRRLEGAHGSLEAGDFARADQAYTGLDGAEVLTPFYKDLVTRNLASVRDQLFLEQLTLMNRLMLQEKYPEAVGPFEACKRLRPEHPILKTIERKLATFLDNEPPRIEISSPAGMRVTVGEPRVRIEGVALDNRRVERVSVNGQEVVLQGTEEGRRRFSTEVTLREGENRVKVTTVDGRGLEAKKELVVTYSRAPVVQGFTYLREEAFSCGGQSNSIKIYRHDRTGLEFVLVPGGEFTMGSADGDSSGFSDERPQHKVKVKPFLLCRTEVTQAAWDKIGGSDERTWRGSDLPIERVSWEDVTAWCKKAGLHLPTEAEWEYACRAGTTSRFCFGDGDGELSNYAWYAGNSGSQTHPAGQKRPNAFGLFDMHGNVWEWCEDWYEDSYRGAPTDGSAWLGGFISRVLRGGSWFIIPRYCRSARRFRLGPGIRSYYLGFRPAASLPEPHAASQPEVRTPASAPAPTSSPASARYRPTVPGFVYLRHETFSCGGQTHSVAIYKHEKTGLEFVLVPGGEFTMGSPDGESGRSDDEGPQHRVRVKPFLLCRTEVTQAAWEQLMGANPSNWKGPSLPVEQVSWTDAQEWCRKAGLRLPTEAEWEYACRAGTTSRFCFGDGDGELSNHAWFAGNSGRQTHPVGQKRPNAFGLYDMHGNVWEWCEDNGHGDYRFAPSYGSAWLGGSSDRVYRGGGWIIAPRNCRSADRRRGDPGIRSGLLGFRPSSPLL